MHCLVTVPAQRDDVELDVVPAAPQRNDVVAMVGDIQAQGALAFELYPALIERLPPVMSAELPSRPTAENVKALPFVLPPCLPKLN